MASERLLEVLSYWNLWGKGAFPTGIERDVKTELLPWLERPEVVAICGLRWCGKSTLMRQLLRPLVESRGVPAKDALFVNFEDPVLPRAHPRDFAPRSLLRHLPRARPARADPLPLPRRDPHHLWLGAPGTGAHRNRPGAHRRQRLIEPPARHRPRDRPHRAPPHPHPLAALVPQAPAFPWSRAGRLR